MADSFKARPKFTGRKQELEQLYNDLNSDSSIRLILGEAGIGKSTLLDKFSEELKRYRSEKCFVGYYKRGSLIIGASPIYPFITALEDLLKSVRDSEQFNEKMKGTAERIIKTTIEFAKSRGVDMAGAILEDIAKNLKLEGTYNMLKDYVKAYREQNTAISTAHKYVSEHTDEAILAYVGILQSLAEEFESRQFVLIFDNFESTGRASFDFLINFILRLPTGFHIIVAFKTEEPESPDAAAVVLYQEAERRLNQQNAEILRLRGMKTDEIREWIISVKGTEPSPFQLNRVLDNSAGIPIVLEEWINQPGDLDYNTISTERFCEYIIERKNRLGKEHVAHLERMAVLAYPIYDFNNLAKFLEIPTNQFFKKIPQLLDRLNEKGLFEKKEDREWFKHDLYRKCLEKNLRNQLRVLFHKSAATFYLELLKTDNSTNTKLAAAYHLHDAGRNRDSYNLNTELGKACFRLGDFDRAERCYRTAIEDAKKLQDEDKEKKCIFGLASVLMSWNRYDEAYEIYMDLEKYFARVDDVNFLPKVKFYLGLIHQYKERPNEALRLYEESRTIAKQRDHGIEEQGLLDEKYEKELGLSEDYVKVPDLYDDSLLFKQGLIWNLNIGATDFYIAYTLYMRGEIANALKWYTLSHQYGRSHEDQLGQAIALTQLAHIYHDQDKYNKALTIYQNLLSNHDENIMRKCLILFEMGGIYLYENEFEKALSVYSDSMKIASELKDELLRAAILHQMGNVHFKTLDFPKALETYHESLNIKGNFESGDYLEQLYNVSKGVTNGQIGRAIMKSHYQASALQAVWKQQLIEALSYIWTAFNLFKNHNVFYYKMTQKDLQYVKEQLGDSEYENSLNKIKNIP